MKIIKSLLLILFLLSNNATARDKEDVEAHFINKVKNLSTIAIFAPYIGLLGYAAEARNAKSLTALLLVPGLTMGIYEFGCKNKHDLNFMLASGFGVTAAIITWMAIK